MQRHIENGYVVVNFWHELSSSDLFSNPSAQQSGAEVLCDRNRVTGIVFKVGVATGDDSKRPLHYTVLSTSPKHDHC